MIFRMGGQNKIHFENGAHAARHSRNSKNCMWRALVNSENFGEYSLSKLKSTLLKYKYQILGYSAKFQSGRGLGHNPQEVFDDFNCSTLLKSFYQLKSVVPNS